MQPLLMLLDLVWLFCANVGVTQRSLALARTHPISCRPGRYLEDGPRQVNFVPHQWLCRADSPATPSLNVDE